MMKRVHVINVKGWSDMVLSLPFLQHLRELHPDAEITLITGRKGETVLHCTKLPVQVLSWRKLTFSELRGLFRSDVCYSISPGLLGAFFAFILLAKRRVGFHQATDAKWNGEYFQLRQLVPKWRAILASVLLHRAVVRHLDDQHESLRDFQLLPQSDRPTSPYLLRGLGAQLTVEKNERVAVLFPFSGAEIKNWPIRRWRNLASGLLESGTVEKICVLGHAGYEGQLSAAFCGMENVELLAGKLCMPSIFSRVRDADIVIANDSLGLHLASLYDRPAVGIFGPNPPKWFGAVSRLARNLYEPMPCSPCRQPTAHQRCQRGHSTCPALRRIGVDEVLAAAKDVLAVK